MDTAIAVRKYTTDHVRTHLLKDETEFHPASVPAFSANTTMKYLETLYPGYAYREVAINPTNLADKARGWEEEIIQNFQADPGKTEYFHVTGQDENKFLHYIKPIRISEESCMQCHSTPDKAPPAMIAKYGDQYGFGWQMGEVVGAQIVTVPMSVPLGESRGQMVVYITSIFIVCTMFFILLNLMLNKVIITPVQNNQLVLEKMANHDHLMGALNRRSFEFVLAKLIQDAIVQNNPLTLVICDLDHFKSVNDTYGHDAGDFVLKEFSRRILSGLRKVDYFCRLGGEEFAIILPQMEGSQSVPLVERLRQLIEGQEFEGVGRVTASFGVTQLQSGDDWHMLMKRADMSLYRAKENGRNRVELM